MANLYTNTTGDSTNNQQIVYNNTTVTTTNVILGTLTKEEYDKLQELREERKKWIRVQKLKEFQKLSAHIRQEIVDEACLCECLNNINSISGNGFEKQEEIEALENKESFSTQSAYIGVCSPSAHIDLISKYSPFINEFTKDELIEAHANATVEESLDN